MRVGEWLIPDSEIEELFTTSGGPGGQHANRTESAVMVRFDVARSSLPDDAKQRLASRLGPVVEATAAESRSQWRNRALAKQRLVERLESALIEPTPRRPTKPSRSAAERRLTEKRARSEKKKRRRRPERND
jgi:ribosome-associated protein